MTTTSLTTASDNTLTLRRWITVGLPATELFNLWLEPDTLLRIMSHFASVTPVNKSDADWQIEGPLGKHYRWDTRIVEAQPGEVIAWRSLEDADIPNEGELRLRPAPGEWGTELALTLQFTPPGGALGKKVTTLFDLLPKEVASKALHRFKSLAEPVKFLACTGSLRVVMPDVRIRRNKCAHSAGMASTI